MNKSNNKIKVIGFVILLCSCVLLAEIDIPYYNSKPPGLSLPIAYERAAGALGPATNQFHCVSAKIETRFSSQGEWFFTFYSTNSHPKWVSVEFNGKIHVQNNLPPR